MEFSFGLMGFLIVFPLIVAAALLFVRQEGPRRVIVCVSGVAIALASVVLVVMNLGASCTLFAFESMAIDFICTGISVAIAAVIVWFAVRYKNLWAAVLAGVQVVGTLILEFMFSHGIEVPYGLYFDSLSLLMTFIIGVVGSGICIYALGYMEDFQAHEPEGAPDRRPMFFALMFVFLSAMYVIVFSNNMEWMFTGWEVTTLCSFLLIGYTRTEEAIANAFRQIIMNLAGGLGFLVALWCCALTVGTFSFYEFLVIGQNNPALTTLAVTALAFAGITKAAQMPFQTWLLGAMVAPTPTSALLHSSTMVKAGVFLLVKLAPVFHVSPAPAVMVMLVGGITFALCSFMAISQSNAKRVLAYSTIANLGLITACAGVGTAEAVWAACFLIALCSFMAISQSNAKRVLAYSTIANLGLITACAGVGTAEAVWAACFLILFHAIAKSLLFLCVGTAEHHIGSRDIESMDLLFDRMPRLARFMMLGIMCMFIAPFGLFLCVGTAEHHIGSRDIESMDLLFDRMPRLARFMMLGIMCMFIAPFGMLLAKWATLVSFVDTRQVALIIILAFGSAATFMFWAKWLGKLSGIAGEPENVEVTVKPTEWAALLLMACLLVLSFVFLPLFWGTLFAPYVASVNGLLGQDFATDNLWLASLCTVIVVAVLFAGLGSKQKTRRANVYRAGISRDNDSRAFQNSLSGTTEATTRNCYMESVFGEARIAPVGVAFNTLIMVAAFVIAIVAGPMGF